MIARLRRAWRALLGKDVVDAEELTEDHIRDLIHEAVDGQRYAVALGWIRLAQRHFPNNKTLLVEEAFCLKEQGQWQQALGLYAQAHDAGDETGEAAYMASLLCVGLEMDPEAKAWAARALEREPGLCYAIIDAAEWKRTIDADPTFRELLAHAERRADREQA